MSTEPAATLQAIHRFGLGARPGDLTRIGGDIRDLFRAEIDGRQLTPLTDPGFASIDQAAPALQDFVEAERRQRESRAPVLVGPAASPMVVQVPQAQSPAIQTAPPQGQRPQPPEPPLPAKTYREEVRARFHAMLEPLGGLPERLVAFWSNHFAVSVNKGNQVRMFAGLFEREAIRPHIHGRFADMLLAVESHPAMIFFLDQQQSLGPNSRAGARRGRGLNENLAREILELHTLGVSGGYSQADVTALASIMTGWSIVPPNAVDGPAGTFRFNANMHEPGDQKLLGKTYPDTGLARGKAALIDIARHPSTAQHVARKLVRHFIVDEPPPGMVARLAEVFRKSDGDLQLVSKALLDQPEAWTTPPRKVRSPQEFLLASARALGKRPEIGQILQPLNAMGHPMWMPGGPNGFADTSAAWASPEGLKTRLDVTATIARQAGNGVDPRQFVDDILGPSVSPETRQAVMRAESRYQGLAIALMSPEFQRR